jgi:photosystem II stability/assembly factor-like uncharacterized protein
MKKNYPVIQLLIALIMFFPVVSFSQWVRTSGPEGGLISAIGTSGNSVIFAAPSTGVYRSTDNGNHWTSSGLDDKPVFGFIFKGNFIFAKDANSGLYRSGDNGITWKDVSFPGLAWCETIKGNFIFIGTTGSIYRSSDNGITWTVISNLSVSAIGSNNNYVFASGYGVNYISSDNGNTWQTYSTGLPVSTPFSNFTPYNSLILANAAGTYGVYKSSNNGINWNSSGLDSMYVSSMCRIGSVFYAIVSKSDCSKSAGVYKTEDNGSKWSLISSETDFTNLSAFSFNSNYLFAGFPNGISRYYIKNDDWRLKNTGLSVMNISGLAVLYDDLYASNSGAGIYYSNDNGESWTDYNAGLLNLYVNGFSIDKNKCIVYAYTNGGIFYTAPGVQKWTPLNSGLADMHIISMTISGKNLYAGCYSSGLYRSTNGGNSWFFSGLSGRVNSLAIGNGVIYAGIRNTHGKPWGILYKSTDAGITWSDTMSGIPLKPIRALIASGNDVYAGLDNGVYRSTDRGNNWVKIISGISDTVITSLCFNNNYIVAGTLSGQVYISQNKGNNWKLMNSGLLKNKNINCMVSNDNYIFSGMEGNSVWRYSFTDNSDFVNSDNKDDKSGFVLGQNSPNPFNPVTKISISIPNNYCGIVTLNIYDVTGKEVSALVKNVMNGNNGVMDVTFDGTKLSSGVYFYKLTAGNFSDIKKMILIK